MNYKCSKCNFQFTELYLSVKDKTFWSEGKWDIGYCKNCGMLILLNPPSKDEIHKYYINYYTHSDKKSFLKKIFQFISNKILKTYFNNDRVLNRIIIDLIPNFILKLFVYDIYFINKSFGFKIFDVGCGNGAFLKMVKYIGLEPYGCDFDKKAIDFINNKYDIKAYCGSFESINITDKFDVITYGHVIEHLYDLSKELIFAKERLNKGGRIIGLTPNANSFGRQIFKQDWRGLEPPRHIKVYTIKSLKNIALDLGLEVEELSTTSRYARNILAASVMIKLNRKTTSSGGGRGFVVAGMGYLLQFVEWIILIFNKRIGEEIYFCFRLNKNDV